MKRIRGQGRSVVVQGALLAGMLLVFSPCAVALDPALDVSQYAHTAWKIRDGFSKGAIYSIAQTPDGYLWLGTQFGLLRFDGVQNTPWQPPGDQRLPPGAIRSLMVTRDGSLWIGADKGLARWRDGKLTQYPELAGMYIFDLLEDRDGIVWVGGVGVPTGRLCAIQSGSARCYGQDGSLGRGVARLYEDRNGSLWVGVETGLWHWKPGAPRFYRLPGEPNGIKGLIEDDDGVLIVSLNRVLQRFRDGKTEPYPLAPHAPSFRASEILRDRDGSLWFATETQGLVHIHGSRIDLFRQSDGLSGDAAPTLFEDREGNIWVGTANGLDRFRDFAVPTFSVKQGLSSASAESLLGDKDGGLWIGTDGGLNKWKDWRITRTGGTARDDRLNVDAPHSLFQDNRGRVWVSTFHAFGHLDHDRFIPVSGYTGGFVLSIVEDQAGNLWLANESLGLAQVREDRVVQNIPWSKLGHQDHGSVLAADPSRDGLWIGFFLGGIAFFSGGQIRASLTAADGLGTGRVSGFLFDQQGALWVSTEGGLSRWKNGRLATLTSKNGLPCDTVHWAMQDDDHSFWLYMGCGLVRVARSDLDAWASDIDKDRVPTPAIRSTVFDTFDGVRILASGGHFSPQVAKTSDGRLWFLPWDGVSVVDPQHLPYNKLPPPVHIEKITADRKTYDTHSDLPGSANGHLRLPPLIRDLQIDYTGLSLVVPEKVLFRYKLEGLDTDWQDAGNRRQAFYTNLPPGSYRFRILACNNSGVWNESGSFLDFSIAPAYYQTTWFRLSCLAFFLGLLGAVYRIRLRQLQYQFDIGLEARVSERTRIARELHDSLLQGFQGLMFRLQAVRDLLPGRPGEAMKALDIALERGDKAIAEGRDTVSDLREPMIGDKDIAQALTALGEELALQKKNGIGPCVRVLVEGKQRDLDPLLRDEVYRIAREALRNAFLHARAQKIEAEITYGDSQFLLHVRDDGAGIGPDVLDQGGRAGHWGLPGMRERAKRFGGQLEVWSEDGAGTEIVLIIPGSIAYGKSSARPRFSFSQKMKWGNSKHGS